MGRSDYEGWRSGINEIYHHKGAVVQMSRLAVQVFMLLMSCSGQEDTNRACVRSTSLMVDSAHWSEFCLYLR